MRILIFIVLAAFLAACSAENASNENDALAKETTVEERKQIMLESIKDLEAELTKNVDLSQPFKKNKAEDLLRKYRDYASINPTDSITPAYLFKAADLSIGLQKYEQSIGFLDNVLKNHPEFEKRVEAMLLKGFVYEYHMNQHGEAVIAYKELIAKYPNHRLAKDAQAAIENLTLTEEELLEKLKKANK